jgi:hypothetical protein
MKTKLGQICEQRKVRDRFIYCNSYCNQTIRLTTIPKPAINIALAPSIFIGIAPFELEPPMPPVDDGLEPDAHAVEKQWPVPGN